jgi:hypothetical protein
VKLLGDALDATLRQLGATRLVLEVRDGKASALVSGPGVGPVVGIARTLTEALEDARVQLESSHLCATPECGRRYDVYLRDGTRRCASCGLGLSIAAARGAA